MKRNTSVAALAAIAGLVLATAPAGADIIGQYLFNGGSPVSTDTEPNSTAGDFTIRPDGVGDPATWGFSTSSGNVFSRSTGTTSSQADTIAADDYWSFTVTPADGFLMNLETITFDSIHNLTLFPGTPTTNATMSVFLRTSVDNYASDVGSIFAQEWNTSTSQSIDLSASEFQDITEATTFRLYVFDSGIDNAANGLRVDNVVLNGGIVVVPEPSTLALVGLSGLALLCVRRSFRK